MALSSSPKFHFSNAVSSFSLKFLDPTLEFEYINGISQEKKTPFWFKWLMLILVILIVIRRLTLLSYAYFNVVTDIAQATVELTGLCVYVGAYLLEVLIIYFPKLILVKGFGFLISGFFVANYNSDAYFTLIPGWIITYTLYF